MPDHAPRPPAFGSELTPEGEQLVIPGCEKDDPRTGARQSELFARPTPTPTKERS